MAREHLRINRFGFAEYPDTEPISRTIDQGELVRMLRSLIDQVLSDESRLDALSDAAQADFAVPLGMAAAMLDDGNYTTAELVSAACTVRYCADPHMAELDADVVRLLSGMPR